MSGEKKAPKHSFLVMRQSVVKQRKILLGPTCLRAQFVLKSKLVVHFDMKYQTF